MMARKQERTQFILGIPARNIIKVLCCQLLYATFIASLSLPSATCTAIEATNIKNLSRSNETNSLTSKVKLLVMLASLDAYQHHPEVARWDRGAEILPGAEIACEGINKNPTILPGYELELVKVDIDRCIPDKTYANINALTTFIPGSEAYQPNVLGITGLFCPELVKRIAPIAGRQNGSNLLQISGSSSPLLRRMDRESHHLSFIIPSQKLYYKAAFRLIKQFEWKNMLVISDSTFHFESLKKWNTGVKVTFREFTKPYSFVIKEIRRSENNIIFVALNAKRTAELMCLSYSDTLTGPEYVWILQNHEVSDLLENAPEDCHRESLQKALQNVFLLQRYDQPGDHEAELVSGETYNSYKQNYSERTSNPHLNLFANVLHDSVWAFALALNKSLNDFNKSTGKDRKIKMMEKQLKEISFQGASGRVQFNDHLDVNAIIGIFQVVSLNGTLIELEVGFYNQTTNNISLNKSSVNGLLPKDRLPTKHKLIPAPLVATLSTICGGCIVLTTVILTLFFCYRKKSKEIKASSPNLSILMFVGCYLLFGGTFIHSITAAFAMKDKISRVAMCGSVITGDIVGVNLIFVTLLVRMLRIYRIFNYFGKTGKVWSDKVLLVIVLVIVGGDVLLIIVWMAVDTFEILDMATYKPNANPPHYEVVQYCSSDKLGIWLSLVLVKVGILFLGVLFLAVKTRKIRKENFKDTKKVNMYIFVSVMIISTTIPLWFLLNSSQNSIGKYVTIYLSFGLTGLLCLVFLFIPKVSPPVLRTFGWKIEYEYEEELQTHTTIRLTRVTTAITRISSNKAMQLQRTTCSLHQARGSLGSPRYIRQCSQSHT